MRAILLVIRFATLPLQSTARAKLLENIIKAEQWHDEKTDEEIEVNISYFMNHGMNRKEAEDYCRQQNGIAKYLKKNRGDVAITKVTGYMISYGWK